MKSMIYFTGIISVIFFTGCENNLVLKSTLPLNDTLEIANFETKFNFEHNLSLRMDSVLSDSRCPSNVVCVWEGNAAVRFRFQVDSIVNHFVLNTHGGKNFISDTLIQGYRINLLCLSPYPEEPGEILQVEYQSVVVVSDL